MKREDIEHYNSICEKIYSFCTKVVETLSKDHPEVLLGDEPQFVDAIIQDDDELEIIYSYNEDGIIDDESLYFPLEALIEEDVEAACSQYVKEFHEYNDNNKMDIMAGRTDMFN